MRTTAQLKVIAGDQARIGRGINSREELIRGRPVIRRVILSAALALLGLAGCTTMPPDPQAQRDVQSSRYDWLDIRQARNTLIGKPPQQVVHTIGRPDREAGGGHWEWWTYENRFHDLITRRTIRDVTLVFRDGTLVDITY